MYFVLDASVALCWLYRDERDARADAALSLLQRRIGGRVPMLWWYELRNAALVGVRRKRVSDEDVTGYLEDMGELLIHHSETSNDEPIFALARRHRLTFYDACYLELAQREGLSLATLDKALAEAATAEGIALIGA